MTIVKEIIADMEARRFAVALEKFSSLKNPDEIFETIKEYMYLKGGESSKIITDGLYFITKEQFKELIALSLEDLKQKKIDNTPRPKWHGFTAERIIEEASYQYPELLHEHLESIFELQPNKTSFTNSYPFRNMPRKKIEFFKNRLKSVDNETALKILQCLTESRDIETVNFVYNYMRQECMVKRLECYENYPLSVIEPVGFTIKDEKIVNFCPSKPYHLVFESGYLHKPLLNDKDISCYDFRPLDKKYNFGGVLEDGENPLCRIITFDEIPEGINIKSLKKLTIGMHLKEDKGMIFYEHDDDGNPVRIGDETNEYLSDNYPLKPTLVSLSPVSERFVFQSWEGHLHRLGGEPVWVQSADIPICPKCGEKMDFLMQINTGLPDTNPQYDDGEVFFGSGGILYIFWCDSSKVSCCFAQWT